ncbi:zonular occludens toxin domain-containing protein [Malikia sp.]|uniref:zonular occludens toxin domain-containing protein n=1 Tax=Malikia sp. TaxID=2070706 RepID=UPI00261A2DA6|nr:zonular occludens toxin domain-containing protein [Malikia sp.]MDD2730110.1 zonular occludens toxin domain-containing protein [Malikia sp.]
MITIITGTPGAGKTLYAISKLIRPLIGSKVSGRDDDGNEIQVNRTIYTNINGALFDHELIDGGDNQGLRDWHKWAKPGSVIVFDEFQKPWPPRANGSKVPDDIQALDTHRHMGVDFILITQSPMNVDRHVHGLCGRHLHVRRMGNMGLTIVYEWDHCSRSLMYSKSIAKAPWKYDKSVFQLYKSAELHTKTPRRIPSVVWLILLAFGSIAYLGPAAYGRISARSSGESQNMAAISEKRSVTVSNVQPVSAQPAATPAAPGPSIESSSESETAKPVFSGCIMIASRCQCFDQGGAKLDDTVGMCESFAKIPVPGRLPDSIPGPAPLRSPVYFTVSSAKPLANLPAIP